MERFNLVRDTLVCVFLCIFFQGCSLSPLEIEAGRFLVSVETGKNWLHDYPILGPIKKKNPPTYALWITDEYDRYIDTIYVTKKMGEASWVSNDDNRPEALPLWSYMRGGQPSEKNRAPDGVTGATAKVSSKYLVSPGSYLSKFKIWLEINHSIDYNDYFPTGINDENASNFSGGEGGSGQPALVYSSSIIDMVNDSESVVELILCGHSEPGGAKTGTIYGDLSKITSAKKIIANVKVELR